MLSIAGALAHPGALETLSTDEAAARLGWTRNQVLLSLKSRDGLRGVKPGGSPKSRWRVFAHSVERVLAESSEAPEPTPHGTPTALPSLDDLSQDELLVAMVDAALQLKALGPLVERLGERLQQIAVTAAHTRTRPPR